MAWASSWLESSAKAETSESQPASPIPTKPGRTERGWVSVVRGIRRSLDVHLRSYFKIDNAFAASLHQADARSRLEKMVSGLVDTGLVDFAGVCLVNPAKRTFGVASLCGPGSESFPAALSHSKAKATRQLSRQLSSRLNFFTRSVFMIDGSNWSVEDVANSGAPWYYDCTDTAYGLPKEASWLQRAGMRSVLSLPCTYDGCVQGVLLVATRMKNVDHLLLRKLEELCYRITPCVVDALAELQLTLTSKNMIQRYESVSDFAHTLLWEMQTLDRKVYSKIHQETLRRTVANVSGACAPATAERELQMQQQAAVMPPMQWQHLAGGTKQAQAQAPLPQAMQARAQQGAMCPSEIYVDAGSPQDSVGMPNLYQQAEASAFAGLVDDAIAGTLPAATMSSIAAFVQQQQRRNPAAIDTCGSGGSRRSVDYGYYLAPPTPATPPATATTTTTGMVACSPRAQPQASTSAQQQPTTPSSPTQSSNQLVDMPTHGLSSGTMHGSCSPGDASSSPRCSASAEHLHQQQQTSSLYAFFLDHASGASAPGAACRHGQHAASTSCSSGNACLPGFGGAADLDAEPVFHDASDEPLEEGDSAADAAARYGDDDESNGELGEGIDIDEDDARSDAAAADAATSDGMLAEGEFMTDTLGPLTFCGAPMIEAPAHASCGSARVPSAAAAATARSLCGDATCGTVASDGTAAPVLMRGGPLCASTAPTADPTGRTSWGSRMVAAAPAHLLTTHASSGPAATAAAVSAAFRAGAHGSTCSIGSTAVASDAATAVASDAAFASLLGSSSCPNEGEAAAVMGGMVRWSKASVAAAAAVLSGEAAETAASAASWVAATRSGRQRYSCDEPRTLPAIYPVVLNAISSSGPSPTPLQQQQQQQQLQQRGAASSPYVQMAAVLDESNLELRRLAEHVMMHAEDAPMHMLPASGPASAGSECMNSPTATAHLGRQAHQQFVPVGAGAPTSASKLPGFAEAYATINSHSNLTGLAGIAPGCVSSFFASNSSAVESPAHASGTSLSHHLSSSRAAQGAAQARNCPHLCQYHPSPLHSSCANAMASAGNASGAAAAAAALRRQASSSEFLLDVLTSGNSGCKHASGSSWSHYSALSHPASSSAQQGF